MEIRCDRSTPVMLIQMIPLTNNRCNSINKLHFQFSIQNVYVYVYFKTILVDKRNNGVCVCAWVGVNVRPNSLAAAINADDVIAAVMEVTNDIKRLNFYNDSQTENGVTRKE